MKNGCFISGPIVFVCLLFLSGCGATPSPGNLNAREVGAFLAVPDVLVHDFGIVAVNSATDKSFTVVNQGVLPATQITGLWSFSAYTFKGGNYPGVGGSCTSTIAPQSSCTVVITFAPTYAGTFNEFLQLTYHNGTTFTATLSPIIRGRAVP